MKIIFLFLLLFSGYAGAETMPAENTATRFCVTSYCATAKGATVEAACAAGVTHLQANGLPDARVNSCVPHAPNAVAVSAKTGDVIYGYGTGSATISQYIQIDQVSMQCPLNGGWELQGTICTRADCPQGQTRNANGVCETPCPADKPSRLADGTCVDACGAYKGVENMEGLWIDPTEFKDYCIPVGAQKCAWAFSRMVPNAGWVFNVLAYPAAEVWSVGIGSCEVGKPKNSPSPPPNNPDKKPPCAASEGVLTSSSGTVACVPEGTPNASKPKISENKTKKTNPDGSVTETTKTTTTDPATGASTTTSSSTTTSAGGSQSGSETMSESKGSFNGSSGGGGDNSGDEPGECAKEPDSPMCKKGTVKEKGKFGDGQGDKLEEAKQQLTDAFNTIKAQAQSTFSAGAAGGGGALPCPPPVTVLGRSVSVCVSDYSNQLSVIGSIIVFAAGILAILLVVTA